MAGLYIHIPFCASRCIYCGFYSTTLTDLRDDYIDAACREMVMRTDFLPPEDRTIRTVYLGGGTPSQLNEAQLEKLFTVADNVFDLSNAEEITMECNPDDITDEFSASLRNLPVNRISMGAQTFNDQRLRFLRRRHCAEDVLHAVRRLRNAGINNISIDLMFGFPDETLSEWHSDVLHAIQLDVEHISAYSLMYDEGTTLTQMLERGEITETDEETSRAMYYDMIDMLTSAGYEHYEISNFAKPLHRSKHNSSYWQAVPYIGIGAAAHSYNLSCRQWNINNVRAYINDINSGKIPAERELLTDDMRFDDLITTALRTKEGIDLAALSDHYAEYLTRQAAKFVESGLLKFENNHLLLTREALFVSDMIMSDLMKI